jgi:hypothetical protein
MNKYPKFKKTAVNPVANVVTLVMALDEGMEFGTLQLRITNDQPSISSSSPNPENFARTIRLWVTTESDIAAIGSETATLIEPKVEIAPNGSFSVFGLTLGGNERVYVRSSGAGVNVRASALQHEIASV